MLHYIIRIITVCQKPLNIDMDHIILVKMLFEVGLPAYLQSRKHLLRICAFTIIRSQHISCIRFSEPPRPTIADISICCIKNTVCVLDQASLIHIYSGVKSNLKCTVVRVHKSSHAFQTPF